MRYKNGEYKEIYELIKNSGDISLYPELVRYHVLLNKILQRVSLYDDLYVHSEKEKVNNYLDSAFYMEELLDIILSIPCEEIELINTDLLDLCNIRGEGITIVPLIYLKTILHPKKTFNKDIITYFLCFSRIFFIDYLPAIENDSPDNWPYIEINKLYDLAFAIIKIKDKYPTKFLKNKLVMEVIVGYFYANLEAYNNDYHNLEIILINYFENMEIFNELFKLNGVDTNKMLNSFTELEIKRAYEVITSFLKDLLSEDIKIKRL